MAECKGPKYDEGVLNTCVTCGMSYTSEENLLEHQIVRHIIEPQNGVIID